MDHTQIHQRQAQDSLQDEELSKHPFERQEVGASMAPPPFQLKEATEEISEEGELLQLKPGGEVAQLAKVYAGPTREKEEGFNEDEMYGEFSKSPEALELEEMVGELGFRYVGGTGSDSKANTDFSSKQIRINKDLHPQVAALSLGYELKNAQQKPSFDEIMMLLKYAGKEDLAIEFANRILKKEARSILFRSQMAISMGSEALVKNPVYNAIAKEDDLDEGEKVKAIFTEMKANGTVHGGAKKAFDHYIEMYWSNVPKPLAEGSGGAAAAGSGEG